MITDTTCPKCGSTNTQRASMLVSAGTSSGEIMGGAVGRFASRWGGSLYAATTASRTDLAQSYSLPPRPTNLVGNVLIGMGLLAFVSACCAAFMDRSVGTADMAVGCVLAFALPSIAVGAYRTQKTRKRLAEWTKIATRWETLWVCIQCGCDWELTQPGDFPTPQPGPGHIGQDLANKKTWNTKTIVLGCLGVFVALNIIMAVAGYIVYKQEERKTAELLRKREERISATQAAFDAMTPQEHLDQARNNIASGQFNNALKHLNALPPDHKEANKLRQEIISRD